MKTTRLVSALFLTSLIIPNITWANYAIVLPGQHEQGIDLQGNEISAHDVIDWELNHSDLIFGANAHQNLNTNIPAVGYMYNQKLELNSGPLEDEIREIAERYGIDYEDFFLHFSEDTILVEPNPTHGENTLLNRKPMLVGYTADAMHAGFALYQPPPWDADVFEHFQQGGALYLYHSEQFDSVDFEFSRFAQGGKFWIEYPSEVNTNNQVIAWSHLVVSEDNTENMTQNQAVSWQVPSDWLRASTHDGSGNSYGGGQFFGSSFVRDGGRLYVVRVRWQGQASDIRPRLNRVQLGDSFPKVARKDLSSASAAVNNRSSDKITHWRKIRGFDQSADLNDDNYLSPAEYQNRSNKSATARFRWQSRVIPFGRMWDQNSSWSLTNLANPGLLMAMGSYYGQHWTKLGLRSAYNDDTNKLLGSNQFDIYSGGNIAELDAIAGSTEADERYKQQFSAFLKRLTAVNDKPLIGLNIGTANLYGRNGQSHLIDAGNLYFREHYIFPSTGFSGYGGLSKFWDNSALGYSGSKVIQQATTRYGRVQFFGNNQENWQQDQYSTLAIYYLNHHPEQSYFNQWNSGYVYGSNNTTTDNFWKARVPKNMAYRPTPLLNVDLGVPSGAIPKGFQPLTLMLSTRTPKPEDYTIVGNTSQTQVAHQELPYGKVSLLPTHAYFLYQSDKQVVEGGPADMVIAREFEHGRVLYRTDFYGKNADFYAAEKISIRLDPPMKPVNADGRVGEYIDEVQIGGYQGLILLY
ncbi:hypothetical protein AAFX33_19835 [Vibrio chagasii]|uniref:hypothetical protein n=1 Tax=Vibrio chagasii TaxID=170679 RepID=UPI0038CDA552